MKQKYLKCKKCGRIVEVIKDSNSNTTCCNEIMEELIPGDIEASKEKHIPEYSLNNNIVHVFIGSIKHPMEENHYIEWVSIQTKFGSQRKHLKPGDEPEVCFALCEKDQVEAVYAYCNIHGLWVK